MSEGFNINILSGKARELAINIDNRNKKDNILSGEEISIFLSDCKQNNINVYKEPWFIDCLRTLNKHLTKSETPTLLDEKYVAKNDATYVATNTREILKLEKEEPVKANPPSNDFDVNTNIRTDYDWSVEKFNKVLDDMINAPRFKGKFKGSVLVGKGEAFIKAAKEFNVDPRILVAIAMCESERGTSHKAKNLNNIGGLVINGKYHHFERVEDSIRSMAKTLNARCEAGYTTPEKISYSGKYCEKASAPGWLKNVSFYLSEFNKKY